MAAGVALLVRSALETPAPQYVGVKGAPAVQLLVHRAGATAIWDGHSPVRAGDTLALRAGCAGLSNVTVATEDPARGDWVKVSSAPCSAKDELLPFTLVVDGKSREEHLAVVMSDAPLGDDALRRAAADTERSRHAWVVRFVIPEEP